MTDFQVGDRVSIVGVVTYVGEGGLSVEVRGPNNGLSDMCARDLTLVERPLRKLRVGSVWQRRCPISEGRGPLVETYVWTGRTFVSPSGDRYDRGTRDLDTKPDLWREVPVEELEGEAS